MITTIEDSHPGEHGEETLGGAKTHVFQHRYHDLIHVVACFATPITYQFRLSICLMNVALHARATRSLQAPQ